MSREDIDGFPYEPGSYEFTSKHSPRWVGVIINSDKYAHEVVRGIITYCPEGFTQYSAGSPVSLLLSDLRRHDRNVSDLQQPKDLFNVNFS